MADKPTECLTTSEDRGDESDELLRVGLEFSSYEDLCCAIKTYERLHFVTLYIDTVQAKFTDYTGSKKASPKSPFC